MNNSEIKCSNCVYSTKRNARSALGGAGYDKTICNLNPSSSIKEVSPCSEDFCGSFIHKETFQTFLEIKKGDLNENN